MVVWEEWWWWCLHEPCTFAPLLLAVRVAKGAKHIIVLFVVESRMPALVRDKHGVRLDLPR